MRPARPTRREWLANCVSFATAAAAARAAAVVPLPERPESRTARSSQAPARVINTVRGPIPPDALGLTLMHEHVLVDFIGAADVSPARYDADAAFARVLPYLEQVRSLGAATIVECTPAYLGRDPALLRRLSDASGLHILTNTGYYGANQDRHLPAHAFSETPGQLAKRWIEEAERGLENTGIRPAFMKIGVDAGPLSPVDAKLVGAAAIVHQATGLPIAAHTGNGVAALEEIDLLEREGVPLSAFIWVHAQGETDTARHAAAASRGAWIEFDGISEQSVERHAALVLALRQAGHLDRVLVSHDAGWYRVGEPDGGAFRPYDTVFTRFIPALRAAGVSEAEVRQLLVDNPRRALSGSP